MVKKVIQYYVTCDVCKSKSITVSGIKELVNSKWKYESNVSSSDDATMFNSIKKIICPDCVKKEREEIFANGDFIKKLYADYFNEHPNDFYNYMIKYMGVQDSHKVKKAYNLAWENGHSYGYSEVYSYFQDYIELIKD